MGNTTPTSRAILTGLIISSKKLHELLESPTDSELELLNGSINCLYDYIKSKNAVDFYSKECFFKFFYNVATDDEELPSDLIEWAMKYLGSEEYWKETDSELLENLKVQIEELRRKNAEDKMRRQLAVIKNEEETAEIRGVIAYNAFNCCSYSDIAPLVTYAINHDYSLRMLCINIFTYGYITGKRTERARRKKKSN